jgi:acetylserotonin N-methyltransferase
MTLSEAQSADVYPIWESYLSPLWFPAVMIADELGIFSALAARPMSIDEVAAELSLNDRVLGALLPMLSSLGYLAPRLGNYYLTETATAYLLPESEFYWGGVLAGSRRNSTFVDSLRRVLTTPDPPDAIPGAQAGGGNSDSWATGQISPEAAKGMAAYMHSHSAQAAVGLAASGVFASSKRFLDVGGCSGVFSIALAQRYPELRATIMDLGPVCDEGMAYVARAGLQDRIDAHAADMFRSDWPEGYDVHFFSNMFHDWRPATCRELARRSFKSLAPGGSIDLHEMLIDDDGSGPRIAASFAMLMVAGTQGQQYSFAQLRDILVEAGFVDVEVRRTTPTHSLVRGHKPA